MTTAIYFNPRKILAFSGIKKKWAWLIWDLFYICGKHCFILQNCGETNLASSQCTQAKSPRVNFTWTEFHVKFTGNFHMNFKWNLFHVNFTWIAHAICFMWISTWNCHLNFTWNLQVAILPVYCRIYSKFQHK